MIRLLICLFVVFGLAAAPVMASVCADDCATQASQHDGAGSKNSDQGDTKADAVHHCCHVHVSALPDRTIQPSLFVTGQKLSVGKESRHTSHNPSPLLEPPSRA